MQHAHGFFTLAAAILLTSVSSTYGGARFSERISPDGSTIVFVSTEDGDAEIYTARRDGSQGRKLTDNDTVDNYPDWSPDGKQIVFMSKRTGQFQIHVMDSNGQAVRQLTREEQGTSLAKYGRDGRIAYAALRGRKDKIRYYDLIVMGDKGSKTIAHRKWLHDFAWSPDGKVIVYGRTSEIVFHDLKTGDETVVPHKSIDKRLGSHFFWKSKWRPDSKSITCEIIFAGGRMDDGTGAPKIFGDDEQFIIHRNGKTSWRLRKQLAIDSPNGTPIIAADEIVSYDWDTHTMTLKPGVKDRLSKKQLKQLIGRKFEITAYGKTIYSGLFAASLMSRSINSPVINLQPMGDSLSPNEIRIELGYPTEKFFKGKDPRGAVEIRESLDEAGKLRD